MFQLIFCFPHYEELKSDFSHRSISFYDLCTKGFRVFGGQKSCIELKKGKTLIFKGQNYKHTIWKYRDSYTNLCFRVNSKSQFHILVLWILSCSDVKLRRNPHSRSFNNSNMPNLNTGFQIQIYVSEFFLNLTFKYGFGEFNRVPSSNNGKTLIFIR